MQPSPAAGGSPSSLLTAKAACNAPRHAERSTTSTQRSSPGIRKNWHWKDAEGGVSSIPLDQCRISYSPSQIWNFRLNPIAIVDLQVYWGILRQGWSRWKCTRRWMEGQVLPVPYVSFRPHVTAKGKPSASGDCYNKLYLNIAVL